MSIESSATKSLAILPFRAPPGKESSAAVLGDGLADSLGMRLYDVEGLELRPTASVRQFLSQTDDSFALGNLLRVDYILEGYIFPGRERTRFTVQLLNVTDRSVLWAAQFDEKETDVFRLEDLVSDRIFKAVLPLLELATPEPITDSAPTQPTGEMKVGEILPEQEPENLIPSPPREATANFTNYRAPLAVTALLILIAAVTGLFLWNSRSAQQTPALQISQTPRAILVEPFSNLGTKPVDNSLGIGLAETLTSNLGNFKNLFVLSANAGRDAARAGISISQIESEFKADYLLRGSLRQTTGEPGEIEAVAEFIETRTGKNLWTKTFQTSERNLSNLQIQVTEAVLESLSIEISPDERQKLSKRLPNNGVAYEYYLAGRHQMATRSHQGLHKAIGSFKQALEKDPQFALAYVGLADAYALENLYEIPAPPEAYRDAKKNALQALKIDENLAEAHASLGYILSNSERNRTDAEREFRRAIELNPSYSTTHHWFAIMLAIAGRHSEAIAEITLAQKLDPHSAVISSAKGMIHFYARQYREGINECEKALKIDTGFVPAHKIMRWTFQGANDYAGAAIAFQKEKNFSGSAGSAGWLVIEAQVEALGGNSEKARGLLEKGLANDFVRENPMAFGYEIALAYTALDEREKALDWLEKAEAVNNHSFNFIEVDPRLDNIREDPRFAALIKKLKNLQITQVAGYQNIEGVVRHTR